MSLVQKSKNAAKRAVRSGLVRAGIDPSALRPAITAGSGPEPAHRYANGLATELPLSAAEHWKARNSLPIVVALIGSPTEAHAEWMRRVRHVLPAHFLIAPHTEEALGSVPAEWFTHCGFLQDPETARLPDILRWVHQFWRRCDLIVVDASAGSPSEQDILRLQHASREYDADGETYIVTPAYRVNGVVQPGFDYEPETGEFVAVGEPVRDYGQDSIPRYVLTALAHGLLIRTEAVDRVLVGSSEWDRSSSLDEDVSLFVARAWQQGLRTLAYTPVRLDRQDLPRPVFSDAHASWLRNRNVIGPDGRRRIIFVLNATSMSGGIRVVFEEAEGLAVRGFDVEIWSLQGQPDWTDVAIPITTFRTYFDMMIALRKEEAIKVATWWETQLVVWLSSVVTGIPVNFAQEFEAWFYPDQRLSRAAVAASARREFRTLTTGSYQAGELRDLGVSSTIIPVGYDPRLFFVDERAERRPDALLAVGRSFFQKNFQMIADAWGSLGDDRPELVLFGFEPDILADERVTYEVRPSHRRVNELYNEASAFVLTSLHEGFGLPQIEAMAAGCPVITTDAHGNRDFCIDRVNCIIVPQRDPEALAAAVQELLADPDLRQRLSTAGLATAAEYAWPVIFDALATYYESIE